jgi:hypothetical protein
VIHRYGPKRGAVLSLLYFAGLCALFGIAFWRIPEIAPSRTLKQPPWPQFLGTIFTGWILFLTYLGSRFDGARPLKTPHLSLPAGNSP